eukprot:1976627-Prymnesium_polylepis.1
MLSSGGSRQEQAMRRVVACPLHVYVHCQKSRHVRRRWRALVSRQRRGRSLVTGYAEHRASLQEKNELPPRDQNRFEVARGLDGACR